MLTSPPWTLSQIRGFVEKAPKTNIIDFSKYLGFNLHSKVVRKNGKPYTDHLEQVAKIVSQVLKKTRYYEPAIGAAYLHDAHEDIVGIVILNPYKVRTNLPTKVILNDELAAFGKAGEDESFFIFVLTRDDDTPKVLHMMNILQKHDSATGEKRDRETISQIIKLADMHSNNNPEEQYCPDNHLVAARQALDKGRIESFLIKLNISDFFFEKGKFIGFDEDLFVDVMTRKFKQEQIDTAQNNLRIYLMQFESLLLAEPGIENGKFNLKKARGSKLYKYGKIHGLIKSIYENSIAISDWLDWSLGTCVYSVLEDVKKSPLIIPGYTPIIYEILKERNLDQSFHLRQS